MLQHTNVSFSVDYIWVAQWTIFMVIFSWWYVLVYQKFGRFANVTGISSYHHFWFDKREEPLKLNCKQFAKSEKVKKVLLAVLDDHSNSFISLLAICRKTSTFSVVMIRVRFLIFARSLGSTSLKTDDSVFWLKIHFFATFWRRRIKNVHI